MKKLPVPILIGSGFGLAGIALTFVGMIRGSVPMNPASIAIALLIGGGVWFLVTWAVAMAAVTVESDLAGAEQSLPESSDMDGK